MTGSAIDAQQRAASLQPDGRWLIVSDRILAAREEPALLDTLDMGMPIADALAVDVPAAARCIACCAAAVEPA